MPCSSSVNSTVDNGGLRKFKLNESTFLASLMPKKEIGADRFLEAHPQYDGRGVVIAIFDSGVDPAAAGLQVTTDGKQKVLDVIDCTGSGDIDTSNVVKADADGCISGASGKTLLGSGTWGISWCMSFFTDTLTSRLKKERKKKWDEKHQEAIAEAIKHLDEFDKKHVKVEEASFKRAREDLQNRVDFLRKQADSYDDKGPVIDAVVWHDGELWRVALDTQNLEDDPEGGKLADFVPLTNYRIERKFGVFSSLDACSFVANVYDDGNVLSIVTDCSPHGTHVAGIATAYHSKEPLLNGVAPGAQLISCKIGDSRLGSMETGTGLIRALIAAVEHKCDLINMSYGEPTLLPDYGRFVDLVDEVVNKHRIIFVSSAGNSGPALSTVGAPGGTSSSIIGVGAYVSPAMAAGAHCVVDPPPAGLEYTWSSRGPTVDGDRGVCISAPGGAVAPVPTWTLQRRMLMNGTSMASPSACGGVALLVSAMKAEGIPVSPYTVREALENTCIPVGDLPEDKLSTGQGLMQVDKAHEYIQKLHNLPCVRYEIKIKQAGKSSPTSRGIYLREANGYQQSTEWTVQVEPKFHEDASNLEQLVPFEECIELRSTGNASLKAPEYLLLTHNGRNFNIVIDPTNLADGLHYQELYGIDCKAPWRGALFRIPITITKAMAIKNRPAPNFFSKDVISTRLNENILRYLWVLLGLRLLCGHQGLILLEDFLLTLFSPLQRPMKWESVVTFSSPCAKSFAFSVEGGRTMELAIAQFWSSGIGSHETTVVDFEIAFHGININKEEVVLDGSEAPVRIDAETLLSSEKLAPAAFLNKIRVPYRPIDAKMSTLSTNRDKLPSGKHILALTLTYKFKLEDGAEVKPQIPLLNNRIYDNKFESQFYMISDSNKRVYAMGDVYPNSTKLPKGEYNIHLYLSADRKGTAAKCAWKNVRDAKIKVLASLKQGTDEERSEWKKLSVSLKSEYPKYTPLLAKILEGLLAQNNVEDKICHYEEIIDAADEVVDSVDTDELMKYFSLKNDPEDEGAEKVKKKMETTRDQLADALYQKGLAMAEIESLKGQKDSAVDDDFVHVMVVQGEKNSAVASTEGANVVDTTDELTVPDLFEENFKELRKWVDLKSSKYGTLLVIRERRCGRLGTALKAVNDMIQDAGEPPKKKLYELKLSLLDEIGWGHLVSYERQWMHIRFPASLPLF
ncbi:tripeptidyl peptidase ii [Actinidia rufa]|uniref:tripeptidyl-peptidase II n=1 Tax=Actinidia rufa TaxID=165716 RepID=A0A7J0GWY0_9ERIC|nr:tripeptidyl peptidase ii [Actinidia rufa]